MIRNEIKEICQLLEILNKRNIKHDFKKDEQNYCEIILEGKSNNPIFIIIQNPSLYQLKSEHLLVFDKVKDEIPNHIGVYVYGDCVKKPKKQEVDEKTVHLLKDSMLRSLYRYFEEIIQNDDDSLIKKKNRYIGHLKYERDKYYQQYWELKKKYEPVSQGKGKGKRRGK